jgi:DNA-binding NarL/FixJ family response regulator
VIVVPVAAPTPEQQSLPAPIEALLIDRQPLFLAALATLLEAPPVCAHVVTTSRSDAGLELVRLGSVGLILCELHSEPLSAIELVGVLADEDRRIPVVVLGDDGDEAQLASALTSNVAGAFTKNSPLDEFLVGVRAVAAGHRAIGSGLMVRLLERAASNTSHDPKRAAHQLSPTELEILAMIGQAQSIPAIAASRGISHKTVRNHLAKIYRKLELHGKTEAILWAARMGLTGT